MYKKLYHISFDLKHTGEFFPRIPEDTFDFECKETKRICASDTIEGCLGAVPDTFRIEDEEIKYIKIFEIIPAELGLLEKDVISSEVLYKKGLLHDSIITGEHWITKPFKVPANRQTIHKMCGVECFSKLALPFKLAEQLKTKYYNEILEFKEDFIGDLESTISHLDVVNYAEWELQEALEKLDIQIVNVHTVGHYGTYKEYSNEEQEIFFDGSPSHINNIIEMVMQRINGARVTKNYKDQCYIYFPKHSDLKEIFLYDYEYQVSNLS